MESVKLLIWDLDDTFWGGTLSEEGITYRPEHQALVIALAQRGILNSICSKNDADHVRRELESRDIWDYFVFSKIEWRAKGGLVRQMLEEMGLRAANVAFVDDNPTVLQEVVAANPGLQILTPPELKTILDRPEFGGKHDPSLSRLKQYQLLESKRVEQKQYIDDNEAFLRQCGIRVLFGLDCLDNIERIQELVDRTNQLNFTKRRDSPESLVALLNDPHVESGYLRVFDRYGDYGLAGFYAVKDGRLEHFLFSCRIMNMGVERWLYDRLERPAIDVQGDVASTFIDGPPTDWISIAEDAPPSVRLATAEPLGENRRILLKGGCDLEQVVAALSGKQIDTEFNYVTAAGAPVHREHTEILKRSNDDVMRRYGDILRHVPFVDERTFETQMFAHHHGVYVFSTLMDMTHGLYRLNGTDFLLPHGDCDICVTDERVWPTLIERKRYYTPAFLGWFRDHFTFEGGLTESVFRDNLRWLAGRIPTDCRLILINGAEIAYDETREGPRVARHRSFNRVIESVATDYPHVKVCDVRRCVTARSDLTDSIRHYTRRASFAIAEELRSLLKDDVPVETRGLGERLVGLVYGTLSSVTRPLRRRLRGVKRASSKLIPSPGSSSASLSHPDGN